MIERIFLFTGGETLAIAIAEDSIDSLFSFVVSERWSVL
jgi:hypothetical protein